MRRSEWRRRADDPKTLLGWWWRGVVDSRFRDVQIVLCLVIMIGAYFRVPWTMVSVLFALPLAFWAKYRPRQDPLGPLLQEPSPTVRLIASVTYKTERMTTGSDRMALMVVDGWLVGEGIRSGFALRVKDVQSISSRYFEDCTLTLTDGPRIILHGVYDFERRVLGDWHESGEVTHGEPTFPPARVHPQETARWSAWWPLGIALAWLPNLTSALLNIGHPMAGPFLTTFLLGSGMAVFGETHARRLRSMNAKAQRDEKELPEGVPPLQENRDSLTAKRL